MSAPFPPPPGGPVPLPTPQRYDPAPDALRYTLLLWSHINRLRRAFGFHHASHEPGGLDEVQMPLGGLVDVSLGTAVADGAALVYSLAGTVWQAGTATGGGTDGQAFFQAVGTALSPGGIPGPTNLTAGAFTITQVQVSSNGDCSGSVAGQSFSFGAGGGADLTTGLTTAWNAGSNISASIAAVGTATTWISADVYFTR
jgi:hypothetical protein